MSENDDRKERAERIRRMRGQEPGEATDADDGEVRADGGTDGDYGDETVDDATEAPNDGTDDADDESEPMDDDTTADEQVESDRDALMTPSDGDAAPTEVAAQAARADAGEVGVTQAPAEPGRETNPNAPAAPESQNGPAASANAPAAGSALAPLGGAADFSLPGEDELAAAAEEADDAEPAERGPAGAAGDTVAATTEPSVRVLEFVVGDQIYCIDIEEVEEIVKREEVTRVPNTEAYVEGVVDLRGQITTILDTKQLLDVAVDGPESLLVIFAPDAFEEHGTVGWVVDEVRQVVPVMDSQVRTAPSDADYVRGVVDRDGEDELVVWIRPGDAMAGAVAVGDD